VVSTSALQSTSGIPILLNELWNMAPLIPSSSGPPPASGARVPWPSRLVPSDDIVRESDAAVILETLRQVVAAGTQQTETIMGSIAEAACSLSGATGAAIAMPRGDAVECVGRSGEAAPELGARLNVDSGISGECLRTGKILRCDDASRNLHVDAGVCRRLGLQSIVAVPLRGKNGRVGVLEAFSSRSYAFDDGDTDMLGRLAGLAETAWAQGSSIPIPSEAELTNKERYHSGVGENASFIPASMAALARIGEALSTWPHDKLQTELKRRYLMIGVTVLVILILSSVLAWRARYKASTVLPSILPIEQRAPAELPDDSAKGDPARRSGRGRHVSHSHVASAMHALKSTADHQKPGSPIQQPNNRSDMSTESASKARSEDFPQIAVSNASPTDLGNVLSTAPAIPRLGEAISPGVTGGTLQYKVLPVYPAQARDMRLGGDVVLEAMVTEEGRIEDLKVISGNPVLAQAASDAVSKWRYSPYMLNGKPIRRETRITISFAPQPAHE
jgi:TonB family protein